MTKQRLQLTWYNKDKALIPTETGKYGYTWVDPSDPRYCETHTLIMDGYVQGKQSLNTDKYEYSERANLEPQSDNLLVLGESGDVLEALTRVPDLADKYVGKVKLIYIDPPFNTAQTFASYEDNLEHSIWLTMMRDRLLHLKKLLADDGSIWVHLDDTQVHRMRLLLDEIFGVTNFHAQITWEKADGPRNNTDGFSKDCDIILVYSKTQQFEPNRMDRTAQDNARFTNPDSDPRGAWWDGDPTARHSRGKRQHPSTYGIQHPVTGEILFPGQSANWYFAQKTMLQIMREYGAYELVAPDEAEINRRARVEGPGVEIRVDIPSLRIPNWTEDDAAKALERYSRGAWPSVILRGPGGRGGGLGLKTYIPDRGLPPRTHWHNTEVGHNRSAKTEIKKLFPGVAPFSTPKPERLLERIIHIGSNTGDIVLDCFAGSGTTAAVAQKMGRRWVTCELVGDTFFKFTKQRLEKVIRDQDPGGVTRTKGERVAVDGVELPDGVSPVDAAKFISVLNKLIADDPDAKKSAIIRQLKAASKTRHTKDVINWRGGGGFQVAHLSPSCFDYDPELDRVILTPEATGDVLVESVAANLGFYLLHLDDEYIFDGRRGNTLLKVIEGVATVEQVDWLVSQVQDGETIVLAATSVMDGVRQYLRRACKGSRVVAIPDDIFRYSESGDR